MMSLDQDETNCGACWAMRFICSEPWGEKEEEERDDPPQMGHSAKNVFGLEKETEVLKLSWS